MKKIILILTVCICVFMTACSATTINNNDNEHDEYLNEKKILFEKVGLDFQKQSDICDYNKIFLSLSDNEKAALIKNLEKKYSENNFDDVEQGVLETYKAIIETEISDAELKKLSDESNMNYDDYIKNVKDVVYNLWGLYSMNFENYLNDLPAEKQSMIKNEPEKYYFEFLQQYTQTLINQ